MIWEELMTQCGTEIITERYKVTKAQSNALKEIHSELNIPPSAIVRLALNCFLPKIKDNGFKYSGVKDAWDRSKF